MALDFETIVGLIAIVFGITAVVVTYLAVKKMSNPRLLGYMRFVMFGMLALTAFSIWHTARESFELKDIYGPTIELPEYLFMSLAYVLFLLGAIAVFKMSKEYGFKEQGKKIAQELKKLP